MKEIVSTANEKMQKTINVLKKDLASMKAGRANPAMLDKIEVEYYGSVTPLNQLANVSVPEARILQIQPWDKSSLKEDRKSTRLNSSHANISYAVFCLKKKT